MHSRMMLTILLIFTKNKTNGLTIYDCNHNQSTWMAVDLIEPAPCPDPMIHYNEPEDVKVQILQMDKEIPILAYQCRIIYSKEVTRCGFDGITYGSVWPAYKKLFNFTSSECRKVIKEGKIKALGISYPVGQNGEKIFKKYTSQGKMDNSYGCIYSNFNSEGNFYQKSVEETTVEILVRIVKGTLDLTTETVYFDNGIKANFKDEVIKDKIEGIMVWNATQIDCKTSINEIYYGNASIYTRKNENIIKNYQEAMIMFSAEQTNRYVGLILKEPTNMCNLQCFNTQIPETMACIYDQFEEPSNLLHYILHLQSLQQNKTISKQTKLSYLHLHSNFQNYDNFKQLQKNICNLDKKSLYNKLQSISNSNNQHALLDLYGPGHMSYIAGATVYITKCVAMEASIYDYPDCTLEVPVIVDGKKMFADPLTWIIKSLPTIIPCSDKMPVRWKIGKEWVCASPKIRPCPPPEQLKYQLTI